MSPAPKNTGRGRRRATPTPAAPASVLPPRATGLGLFLLRVWAGGFFLATAWWKLVQEGFTVGEKVRFFEAEYEEWIRHALAQPPRLFGHTIDPFVALLRDVMLPGAPVFAPLILFAEVALGLSLVLGLGVRLSASLGFLMMLAFTLSKPQPGAAAADPVGVFLFTVRSANWPVTLLLLLLALAAAGRAGGLDRWVRARGPRWLRWTG